MLGVTGRSISGLLELSETAATPDHAYGPGAAAP